jgi:hypothetical protein
MEIQTTQSCDDFQTFWHGDVRLETVIGGDEICCLVDLCDDTCDDITVRRGKRQFYGPESEIIDPLSKNSPIFVSPF